MWLVELFVHAVLTWEALVPRPDRQYVLLLPVVSGRCFRCRCFCLPPPGSGSRVEVAPRQILPVLLPTLPAQKGDMQQARIGEARYGKAVEPIPRQVERITRTGGVVLGKKETSSSASIAATSNCSRDDVSSCSQGKVS